MLWNIIIFCGSISFQIQSAECFHLPWQPVIKTSYYMKIVPIKIWISFYTLFFLLLSFLSGILWLDFIYSNHSFFCEIWLVVTWRKFMFKICNRGVFNILDLKLQMHQKLDDLFFKENFPLTKSSEKLMALFSWNTYFQICPPSPTRTSRLAWQFEALYNYSF